MSGAAWFVLGYSAGILVMYGAVLFGRIHVHRWSRWVDFNEPYTMQWRRCSRCGKRRERLL